MPITLPTSSDPFYTFTKTLEGKDYVFDFRFNQSEGAWYFDVALPDGTALASGIKVVCRRELFHRRAEVRLPGGLLIAMSNEPDESPPGLTELGEDRRVELVYFAIGESLT